MVRKNRFFSDEQFQEDVKNHRMKVLHDDGVYRHLEFSDGSFKHRFYLTTWPGHLCVTGDMGSYLFSRIPDMFEFFRGCKPNYSYWHEKVLAQDRNTPVKEFSKEAFKENVEDIKNEAIKGIIREFEEVGTDPSDTCEIVGKIFDHFIEELDCESISSYEYAYNFMEEYLEYKDEDGTLGSYLQGFWSEGCNCEEYSYWFTWCCNVIPWAIAVYDSEAKK
jgi:hypothetical protein